MGFSRRFPSTANKLYHRALQLYAFDKGCLTSETRAHPVEVLHKLAYADRYNHNIIATKDTRTIRTIIMRKEEVKCYYDPDQNSLCSLQPELQP